MIFLFSRHNIVMKNNYNFAKNIKNMPALASRLDLAIEANSLLRGDANKEIEGVSEEVLSENGVTIHIITILNEIGVAKLNRPPGRYITLDIPMAESEEGIADIAEVITSQLKAIIPDSYSPEHPLLVVGLGNNNAIPDALGPKVVELTYATRHLFQAGQGHPGLAPVCAIAPGVLGTSGIETAETILGICEHILPAALIVVDSLAAASISRVGTTIQMSDTGIKPGSGIGNNRHIIDSSIIGCPVIAIGVPTVVDTAAIIAETLSSIDSYWEDKEQSVLPQLDDEACLFAEQQLLERFQGKLMVTPKDIDELIAQDAEILSAAIAITIHPAAEKDNYHDFIR